MRSAICIFLIASAGCGGPGATQPPPPPVTPPPPPLITAPQRIAAVPTSSASAAPPPAPAGPCDEGASVDVAKVHGKIEGSFSRPGVHELIATMSCEPGGADAGARILAARDEGGAFKIAHMESLEGARDAIDRCQVLHTSVGRDLPICRRTRASYGATFDGVVVLDYTKDPDDRVTPLVGVADTTDTACTGATEIVVGKLEKVELVDADHDGNPDVRVTLRAAKVHVPKQSPCKRLGFAGSGHPPPNIPNPPAQTVDFIAHGTTLTPTSAGARVMKMLEKLVPP